MWFVERVLVPIEEQYKYVSESSTDTEDEEWTLGPKKKKKKCNDTIAVSTGNIHLLIRPTACDRQAEAHYFLRLTARLLVLVDLD